VGVNVYVAAKKYPQYDKTSWLISCGLILALLLSFVHVWTSNDLMSAQRIVGEKHERVKAAEETASRMEVQVAQFKFSQNLSEIASSRNMVLTSGMRYLNLSDSSVAMIK